MGSARGTFTISGFFGRTWTLRMTNLSGDLLTAMEWIREVRTPSPAETEVIYRNPHEAFDRSASIKRLRTVSDLPSAARYARKEFRAVGPATARSIEGAIVHSFDIENALEGESGSVVMLEVPGHDRWFLLSGSGVEVTTVAAG